VIKHKANNQFQQKWKAVTVHLEQHNIYVATETGRQMQAVVYYSMCLHKHDHTTARDLHLNTQ
jgi:hypothetical protein